MEVSRILPPLIRGTTRGVLDFFIDEIVIFREIFLIPNCDVIAQVQWWGEVIPVLIRPPIIQLGDKIHKYNSENTYSYHSIRYEIKTTTELFKLYLRTCEVLELAVLEAVQTCVIGSAFLKDILKLIYKNENITTPIVNYEGEKIGEIKIHFNFCAGNEKEQINTPPKHISCSDLVDKSSNTYDIIDDSCLLFKEKSVSPLSSNTFCKQIIKESEVLELSSNTPYHPSIKHILENSGKENKVTANLPRKFQIFDELENSQSVKTIKNKQSVGETKTLKKYRQNHLSTSDKNFPQHKNFHLFFNDNVKQITQNSDIIEPKKGQNLTSLIKNSKSVPEKQKLETEIKKTSPSLPEVKLLKDSSTVLHFNVPNKPKSPKLIYNHPPVCKKKKVVNKSCSLKKHNNSNKKTSGPTKKKLGTQGIQKPKKHLKVVIPCLNLQDIIKENDCMNSEKETTKSKNDKVVLDYLLGSEMSRSDEESALNEIKKMSPTHPLISAISELQSDSTSSSIPDKEQFFVRVNNLHYNLKDPVEKTYYETFFGKSNSKTPDLEVAEFLNQKSNFLEPKISTSNPSIKTVFEVKKESLSCRESGEEVCLPQNFKMRHSCERCNYYKKLDELDVIIESLKHFEKKILSKEKEEEISEFRQKCVDGNLGHISKR